MDVHLHSARTGSEQGSNALNCSFRPEISVEPSHSTPSAGIFPVNDAFYFCCFSFFCAGWLLEDWLSEDPGYIWGAGLFLLGRSKERVTGTVVERVDTGCFSCMNTTIMAEDNVKGLYKEESSQFLRPYCRRDRVWVSDPVIRRET